MKKQGKKDKKSAKASAVNKIFFCFWITIDVHAQSYVNHLCNLQTGKIYMQKKKIQPIAVQSSILPKQFLTIRRQSVTAKLATEKEKKKSLSISHNLPQFL